MNFKPTIFCSTCSNQWHSFWRELYSFSAFYEYPLYIIACIRQIPRVLKIENIIACKHAENSFVEVVWGKIHPQSSEGAIIRGQLILATSSGMKKDDHYLKGIHSKAKIAALCSLENIFSFRYRILFSSRFLVILHFSDALLWRVGPYSLSFLSTWLR